MNELLTFEAAIGQAEARARRSYFDHYVITDPERGYLVVSEGDYGALPDHMIDRIISCVEAGLIDDY